MIGTSDPDFAAMGDVGNVLFRHTVLHSPECNGREQGIQTQARRDELVSQGGNAPYSMIPPLSLSKLVQAEPAQHDPVRIRNIHLIWYDNKGILEPFQPIPKAVNVRKARVFDVVPPTRKRVGVVYKETLWGIGHDVAPDFLDPSCILSPDDHRVCGISVSAKNIVPFDTALLGLDEGTIVLSANKADFQKRVIGKGVDFENGQVAVD